MNKNNVFLTIGIIVVVALIFAFVLPVNQQYENLVERFYGMDVGDAILYSVFLYAVHVGFCLILIYAFDIVSFIHSSEITNYSEPIVPSVSELPNQENKERYIEEIVTPSQTEVWFEDEDASWFVRWFYIVLFFSFPCLIVFAALLETALQTPMFVSIVLFVSSYFCALFFYRKYTSYIHEPPRDKYLTNEDVEKILEDGYGRDFEDAFGFDEMDLKKIVIVLERVKHFNRHQGDRESRLKARSFLGGLAIAVFVISIIVVA